MIEAITSIAREARRVVPMAAGIVWGVASVFVLVAVGRGFESTQRDALEALGESFVLLRVNRATTSRGDVRNDSFVRMESEDMQAITAGALAIDSISPKANNWFIRVMHGNEMTFGSAVGVEPQYSDIVNVPLEPGSRWIDDNDIEKELPVCVIGYGLRKTLFDEEPFIGEEIELIFNRGDARDSVVRKLRVIGAVSDLELAGDQIYTSTRTVVFLPFTTWERMSPQGFQFFVMRPLTPELKDEALAEMRTILGRRHGFDPANENTLVPYFDAIERKTQIDSVFGGLENFLIAVGALILLLGAVGVANVTLMSVSARTFEFGLRRALGCKRRWIFAQVFLEASLVCLMSGVLGFGLGFISVEFLGTVDLPDGFAAPRAEFAAAWLPAALLFVVSAIAAIWPAIRAARISVVVALHGAAL
ncbi:MAG: putative ABC transport system permease protein [Planctomycetota bacterium]